MPSHQHAGKHTLKEFDVLVGERHASLRVPHHPVNRFDRMPNRLDHPVARAVGDPQRIIAGTDCGFETAAGSKMVIEDVVWAKLRSLSEGAAIASKRLFG